MAYFGLIENYYKKAVGKSGRDKEEGDDIMRTEMTKGWGMTKKDASTGFGELANFRLPKSLQEVKFLRKVKDAKRQEKSSYIISIGVSSDFRLNFLLDGIRQ